MRLPSLCGSVIRHERTVGLREAGDVEGAVAATRTVGQTPAHLLVETTTAEDGSGTD